MTDIIIKNVDLALLQDQYRKLVRVCDLHDPLMDGLLNFLEEILAKNLWDQEDMEDECEQL